MTNQSWYTIQARATGGVPTVEIRTLRRYRGKTTGRVDGVAASVASLILMAEYRIVMPENAMLMIHNP